VIFEMFLAETLKFTAVWSARCLCCAGNFCSHHQSGWRRQQVLMKPRYTSDSSPSHLTRL